MSTWKTSEPVGEPAPENCLKSVSKTASVKTKAAAAKHPFALFKMHGRKYRLFKRQLSDSWYFQIEKDGKRFPTSMKTTCLATATEKAKLLVEARNKDKFHEMRALISGGTRTTKEYCTIAAYLPKYENTPTGENSARSRHHFVLAFRRVLAATPEAVRPTRMDQLGPMFKAARSRANLAVDAAKDNADKLRIQRSFNSEVGNAASVFSQTAAYFLKDQLVLPDFTQLRLDIKFLKFSDAKKTQDEYRPPAAKVRDETLKTWLELPRNEFLAVGLALSCGMRLGEMRGKRAFVEGDYVWQGAADWNWFEVHNDNLWCVGKGNFKDGTNLLRVQVLNPFWDMIVARCEQEGWERTGLIIQGNRSEFDKNISKWMKDLGWETRLHLHALRAWAGSLVFMQHGVRAACSFCRHADEATTKEHYGWMQEEWHNGETAVIVAGKPVEWAVQKTETK